MYGRSTQSPPMWRKLAAVLWLIAVFHAGPAAGADAKSDCLFGWGETLYPWLFVPRAPASQSYAPYYYRYYPQTNAYLGISTSNNHLYYLGQMSGRELLDLGDATPWYDASGCTLSDLQQAKNMFSELRTTLNSFANDGKTGFLDVQARTMRSDMDANVLPDLHQVTDRIGAMGNAIDMFEAARTYTATNTQGMRLGTNLLSAGSTLIRVSGNPTQVWYGYGTYDYCWTDSSTGVNSKVTCAHAASDAADRSGPRFSMVLIELTAGAGNGQYSYTATRYNLGVSVGANGAPTFGALSLARNALLSTSTTPVYLPAGSGTIVKTVAGGQVTNLVINGTLPPSKTTCVPPTATSLLAYSWNCAAGQIIVPASGVDTIALSAVRNALPAANAYRYALTGSVATAKASDAGKVTTLSFDSGSYVDMDEANASTSGSQPVAARFIGTIQSTATKFMGMFELGSFQRSADGSLYQPTSITFDGSVSDTPAGSTSPTVFLTGRIVATVADFGTYYPKGIPTAGAVAGATNYMKATLTFTGIVQAPGRPPLTLVVSGTETGQSVGTMTLNYSYDNIAIVGTGSFDDRGNPLAFTDMRLTLTNQVGVRTVISHTLDGKYAGTVTKSGATLGTIANERINYVDGYSESLN
jgi:hypothetical protein